MSDYEKARSLYQLILNNNGYSNMSMIWAISCIEESLNAYDMDLIITDEDKEKMCNLVLESWLDSEVNIGISKIADLVVENWSELKGNEDNDELMQELINDEVCL